MKTVLISILISIQPKWCELIASGKKTVEVHKMCPQEVPFRAYIYQTKKKWIYKILDWLGLYQGEVIGEFVCDRIDEFQIEGAIGVRFKRFSALAETCLTVKEMRAYAGNKPKLYGWHISDLKIYDKPKELGEFRKPCDWGYDCNTCKRALYEHKTNSFYSEMEFAGCDNELTRPPQSWCYVEEYS